MAPISGSYLDVVMESGAMLDEVVVTGLSGRSGEQDRSSSGVKGMKQAVEIQPVVVIENQIITEFEIDILASVPSDGKTINLELEAFDIPADYIYESTPKADVGAYLIATLTDWEKYHLMEGEANLYFKNTFIGKTIINPVYLHDTLELSLGRDPDIVIKRIKEEEFTKKTFLGTNTIVEKSFKISIRNKKQYPVQVLITDQIPVSVNEAIIVSPSQLSGGILTESSGLIKWRMNIDKEQTKDLILNYSVKYPTRELLALE